MRKIVPKKIFLVVRDRRILLELPQKERQILAKCSKAKNQYYSVFLKFPTLTQPFCPPFADRTFAQAPSALVSNTIKS